MREEERQVPIFDPLRIIEKGFRALFPDARVVPQDMLSLGKPAQEATPAVPEPPPVLVPAAPMVSQLETVEYQKTELIKSLLLLAGHLQQGGRIAGKPCDCIQKTMFEVEALADETTGITGEGFYQELASWARQHGFKGSPQAVASGKYKDEYLDLAGQARQFRKRIMGTETIAAGKEAVKAKVMELIRLKGEQL